MKRSAYDALERLLRNAALAERSAAGELSFGMQTRILAAWRARRDEGETLLRMLRQAVGAAAVVSSLAIACTYAAVGATAVEPERERDIMASVTNSLEAFELSWLE